MSAATLEHAEFDALCREAAAGVVRVTANCIRCFLVTRRADVGLLSVQQFPGEAKAAAAKVRADARPLSRGRKVRDQTVIFSGPSLAAIVAHYPEWFDADASLAASLVRVTAPPPIVCRARSASQGGETR